MYYLAWLLYKLNLVTEATYNKFLLQKIDTDDKVDIPIEEAAVYGIMMFGVVAMFIWLCKYYPDLGYR